MKKWLKSRLDFLLFLLGIGGLLGVIVGWVWIMRWMVDHWGGSMEICFGISLFILFFLVFPFGYDEEKKEEASPQPNTLKR